jgi:hypothetical protein
MSLLRIGKWKSLLDTAALLQRTTQRFEGTTIACDDEQSALSGSYGYRDEFRYLLLFQAIDSIADYTHDWG